MSRSRLANPFAAPPCYPPNFPSTRPAACRYAKRCLNAIMMKQFFLFFTVAILTISLGQAQPTTGSPDPKGGAEMTGTIKDYTPGTALVLETLAPSEPVHFRISKAVTYADSNGKPIEAAGLTTNQKVRVHYTK